MKSIVAVIAVALLSQQVLANSELITKASNTFSNSLYEQVAKEPGNVLVCPISLHIALGLVLQGAASNTSTQLASVLGLSAANAANTQEGYKALITGIKDNTLKIATKLYPAAGYELSTSYVALAQEYFLSGVEGVDYSKPVEAAAKINKYVEDNTNNKIHDLIKSDALSDLTKLVIINAIHFQATWKKTFTTAYDDFFKASGGEKVPTKMMSMTDYFHYKEDPALDAKVLKMDYTDGGYSMLFILPNKEDGLPALEAKLVHTDLSNILKDLHETKVEVTIPKFKLEKTINLKDILISMGITDLFTSRADLNGIANGDKLYVSDVIQKTFINVHENGTEAAAATGIYLEVLSASFDTVTFSAHWPFHFTLIHTNRPRMRLFDGRLVRPSTRSQGPDRGSQTQKGVQVSEESLENNEHITSSGQGTDTASWPYGVNNWGSSGQATNTPLSAHSNKAHKQNKNNTLQTQQEQHNVIDIDRRVLDQEQFDSKKYSTPKPPQQSQNHNTNKHGTNNVVQTQQGTKSIQRESEDHLQSGNQENSRQKPSQQPQYNNTNKKTNNYCLIFLCNAYDILQTQNGSTGIVQQKSKPKEGNNNQKNPRRKLSQKPDNSDSKQGTTVTAQQGSEDRERFDVQEYPRQKSPQQPQNYNTNKKNPDILFPTQQPATNYDKFESENYNTRKNPETMFPTQQPAIYFAQFESENYNTKKNPETMFPTQQPATNFAQFESENYNTKKNPEIIMFPTQQPATNFAQFESDAYKIPYRYSLTEQKQPLQPNPSLTQRGSTVPQWSTGIVQDSNPYQRRRYQPIVTYYTW